MPPGSTIDDAIDAALKLNEPLMPRDQPLWMMYLIQGVKDRTVLLQAGHHAMVDGASGVDISLVLFDLQKNAPQPTVHSRGNPSRCRAQWSLPLRRRWRPYTP